MPVYPGARPSDSSPFRRIGNATQRLLSREFLPEFPPVHKGRMALGTWQGIYLFEHRASPHRRSVALHFIGESAE